MNRVKIKDLGKVITGKTPPSAQPEYFGGAIDFLTPTDMHNSRRVATARNISDVGSEKYSRSILTPGSTAFVCIGATIGKICQVDKPTLSNQQINSVIPYKNVDPNYIYYALVLNKAKVITLAGGAATPIVNKSVFENIELSIHDPKEQISIGNILSRYDDLIENNTMRIEKLDNLAQLLYRKYFDAPESVYWTNATIDSFSEVITGKTPSKANEEYYADEGMLFIKTPDMHRRLFITDSTEKLSVLGQNSQKNKILPANVICLSCIGTVGIVAITTKPSQTNQQINAIKLYDEKYLEYLVMKLQDSKKILENIGSNGATMTNVNKSKVENLEILNPPKNIIYDFHEKVGPIYRMILNLQLKNDALAKSRDLLLPRLMSQDIQV